ncbi:MAG: outer membrane beta-barrel protein [Candidatus Aminicenantales bacterium]
MKKIAIPAVAIMFLLFFSTQAFSQVSLYFGVQGGYSAQTPSFGSVQFDTNTTFIYGLRGGIKVLMFAVELNYFKAVHNIEMEDFILFDWDGLENDYSYIGVNFRYIFSLLILSPYITAGYGYYTADIQNIDKDNEGGYNFGAGVELKLGKKLCLLVEGKYHHVAVNITSIHLGLGDFTLCGGLNIYF